MNMKPASHARTPHHPDGFSRAIDLLRTVLHRRQHESMNELLRAHGVLPRTPATAIDPYLAADSTQDQIDQHTSASQSATLSAVGETANMAVSFAHPPKPPPPPPPPPPPCPPPPHFTALRTPAEEQQAKILPTPVLAAAATTTTPAGQTAEWTHAVMVPVAGQEAAPEQDYRRGYEQGYPQGHRRGADDSTGMGGVHVTPRPPPPPPPPPAQFHLPHTSTAGEVEPPPGLEQFAPLATAAGAVPSPSPSTFRPDTSGGSRDERSINMQQAGTMMPTQFIANRVPSAAAAAAAAGEARMAMDSATQASPIWAAGGAAVQPPPPPPPPPPASTTMPPQTVDYRGGAEANLASGIQVRSPVL